VTDHIVVGDRVLSDASFGAARARLQILARDGMLLRASEAAYGEAITGLVQAAGPAAGLTRLAGICLEDLAETEDCAHIALQWEGIAADGTLFVALDAALLLVPGGDARTSTSLDYYVSQDAARMPVPAGDQVTALTLAGIYRPQPGPAGAGLDQAIVRRCAAAAVGSFLDRVACALVYPAGTEEPWQEATGSYSRAAPKVRQTRTAPLITPAAPCSPPRAAGPGSITGLAVGPGIGYGILDPRMLIFAVSALLAGLLTELITAIRRRHARRPMPVPPVVPPIGDGRLPRLPGFLHYMHLGGQAGVRAAEDLPRPGGGARTLAGLSRPRHGPAGDRGIHRLVQRRPAAQHARLQDTRRIRRTGQDPEGSLTESSALNAGSIVPRLSPTC
jgi:hypothetical protein